MPKFKIGDETKWGRVSAIGIREGEGYYMMIDKTKCVSLIPQVIAEMVD